MTIRSSFFNSVGGDRVYDASIFADYFASFIGNGVFPQPSSGLQVIQNSNLNVSVSPGKGWINGYYLTNDDSYILTLPNADGALNRIDRIVMALNMTTRQIEIYVKRGTPAVSPLAPVLTRNGTIYELSLANVRVSAGALVITQSSITDTRSDNSVCGIVTGTLNQIDTTNLFAQYDAAFREFLSSVQTELSGDVAGNLLLAIQRNENAIATADALASQHYNNNNIHVTAADKNNWNQKVDNNAYATTINPGIVSIGSGLIVGSNGQVSVNYQAVPKNLKLINTINLSAIAANGSFSITNIDAYKKLRVIVKAYSGNDQTSLVTLDTEANSPFFFSSSNTTSTVTTYSVNRLRKIGSLSTNNNSNGGFLTIDLEKIGVDTFIRTSSYSTGASTSALENYNAYGNFTQTLSSLVLSFSNGVRANGVIYVLGGDYN